ncbi:hypothetical protein N7931_17755 [Catenovulum sp. 2E275]|uniref:DUF7832 domain-containing protein n=1 Tax=Catenovulum sp. 2E275 TaxID=2980497 RepID=UPI0021D1D8FB|nr:hypothetical protein [Catenovulum sp. 2E275]MCU4677471.1 hypothetical protein [Catenovulum sp. 2E275]
MNLILSIEDYEGYEPDSKSVEDALPIFTLLYGWALSKDLLASDLTKEPYSSAFEKVEAGDLSLKKFAMQFLDGKITRDMFKEPWISEYVSDYIQTGTYSYELEDFFGIESVFELPKKWNDYIAFKEELSKSFDSNSPNYK